MYGIVFNPFTKVIDAPAEPLTFTNRAFTAPTRFATVNMA
jgi:hypothetical protein